MRQNRTSVQTINEYFNRFNPLKALALVMALAFVQGETFASSREDVTISAPAAASVSISGALRICAGGTTNLTANVSGCVGTPSFTWYRNDVFMPGTSSQSISVDNPGDYKVRVVCGGETVFSESVKVSQFRLKTLVQNACPGSTGNVNLVLIDPVSLPEEVSFVWSNGALTEDLMGVASALYTVNATDANGCHATTSALVQNTIVNVSAGPNKSVCAGGSVQLNGSGADFYEWSPAAGLNNVFAVNPSASPAVNTTYTLTGYVNSGDLVNNGDFNQRNRGFTSDYAYVAGFAVGGYNTGTGLYPEGKYSVVPNRTDTNVTKMHPSFKGVGHNKGLAAGENDDFYMAINGSSTLGQVVWSQTVEVLPNTNYNFATWIASINLGNLSRLRFQINGVALGAEIVAPNALNTWAPFFTVWNSGVATQAVIKIINNNLILSGNDFGLDDISFSVTCSATDQVDVTVLPALAGNVITCPPTTAACFSIDPALLTASAPTGGNGSYTYQWEISDNGTTFSPIDGATSESYNPGPINATTHYRRVAYSGDCFINSSACTFTVTSQGQIGNNTLTSPSPSSFCVSGNPNEIVGSAPTVTSNTSSPAQFSFVWESSTDGNEYAPIEGANGQSYNPGVLTQTTTFRRITRSGNCISGVSNEITITINPLPTIVIPAATERCGAGSLTLEANATGSIKWFALPAGGQALLTNSSIFTTGFLTQTTPYYVEVSNLGCTSARTEVLAVINAKPTITGSTAGFRCGAGDAEVSATASAGTVYWYADAAGTIALGYGNSISVPVTNSTSVFAGANDEGCASAELVEVAIEVGQNTTAAVSAIACDSYTWALNGETYTSSGSFSYESTNDAGCTLTTTLNLTINTSSAVTLNVSINEGDSYTFNGSDLTESGQYTMTSTGANGCPMVTTLNLTVVPTENPTDCGTNKIANGDFEAGFTGFTSAYTYTADIAGNSEMIPENRIAVGTNANNYHPQFIGTGRTGKFLIVNGNKQTVKELWSQDVDVTAGREYVFTMYTQNVYPTAPPRFSFRITPNDLISSPVEFGTFNATTGRNGWIEVTATFNSEYTGSAKLSIYDIDLTAFGNDFGIDDISFIETCPPTPQGCSPVEVISYNPGSSSDFLTPVSDDRQNEDNALGTPEDSDVATSAANYNFVTLGFAGEIVLKFAYPIKNGEGDDLYVVETSFLPSGNQNCTRYPEKIRAYASQDNCNWVYLGEGCQNTYFDLQGLNWAQYVKIVDMTNPESFDGLVDGYDLDGVVCLHGEELNPVPTDLVFGSAQEAFYFPASRKNGSAIPAPRAIKDNALGTPQGTDAINFVSLGFGGSLVVKFDFVIFDAPGIDVQLVETSFGAPSCDSYPEKAMVEGSLFENGPWTALTTTDLCLDGGIDIAAAGVVQYLRVTDRSNPASFSGTADGYDVDGFIVSNNCTNAVTKFASHSDNNETANEVASSEVYPNPFSEIVNVAISTGDLDKTATIKVVNYLGQQVYVQTINVASSSQVLQALNLGNLTSGVYFLTVETNNSRETMKIVKK